MDEFTIRATVVFVLTAILLLVHIYPYNMPETQNISKIAKRDISRLGITDFRLNNSLDIWIYSILVILYKRAPEIEVMPVIREWSLSGIDTEIVYDVEKPYTKFLKIVDDAREKKEEPKFNVSTKYDYHVLSKTLKFNDYVDCCALLIKIDELIGVSANGK